jgi:ATP-dependent DNA ligase
MTDASKFYYPCMPVTGSLASLKLIDNDPHWVAEIKRNGWRCLAIMDDEGKVSFWSRHRREIKGQGMADLREVMRSALEKGTVIDGELLKNGNGENWKLDRPTVDMKEPVGYYAFDVIRWEGKMMNNFPWNDRHSLVTAAFYMYRMDGLLELPEIPTKDKVKLFEESTEHEGIVVKRRESKYPVGLDRCLKNTSWIKVKHERG